MRLWWWRLFKAAFDEGSLLAISNLRFEIAAAMTSSLLNRAGSKALLTDMYQLTMAYAYWKSGLADHEAVFHLFFRQNPFHGGFTLACGLADCVKYMLGFRFGENDTA